jgi:hypothetical protein
MNISMFSYGNCLAHIFQSRKKSTEKLSKLPKVVVLLNDQADLKEAAQCSNACSYAQYLILNLYSENFSLPLVHYCI